MSQLPDLPTEPPPTPKGKSNRDIEYVCMECGREVGKDNLVLMQVIFSEVGFKGHRLRTRKVGWICRLRQDDGKPSCLDQNKFWNLPSGRQA